VGIQAWGSDGDIRPLIALGAALVRCGHQVELVVTSVDDTDYGAFGAGLGLDVRAVPLRVGARLDDLAQRAGRSAGKMLRLLLEAAYAPFLAEISAASGDLCRRSDVVVGHFMTWPLKAAAQRSGVAHVGFVPWPGMVPSSTQAPPGLPDLPFLRQVEWRAVQLVVDRLLGEVVARSYLDAGLRRPKRVLPDGVLSDRLNLLAASPALYPAARDWGERNRVCGAFALPDDQETWTPSDDLAEFLEAGPPPVFLSLGSSEQIAPVRSRELLVGAARRSGRRCILQLKSERRTRGERDGDLYFLARAPHARVFSRCAAVVHHGGAGTTHTAARAGVPSLVVPFVMEQADWGRRLHAAGAAAVPLSFWRATSPALARGIRHAVEDEALQRSSQALAQKLVDEDGPSHAVRWIEAMR
jgi:UDP:flavonoid glycosyltransferase YjiC (YdhE family)